MNCMKGIDTVICDRLWMTALMMVAVSSAASESKVPAIELSAEGEIAIGTNGQVSDYRLKNTLSPTIVALVDRNVRGWKFEPVLVDGSPVVAKTTLRILLKAEPVFGKDEYAISISSISFGGPTLRGTVKPPIYPSNAAAAGLGAQVLLVLRLSAAGKVTGVHPYQTSLDARVPSDSEAENWRRTFERISVDTVRHWRYDMPETLGGKTVPMSVILPIVFSVGRRSGWNAWEPGPVHRAPWMDNGELADKRDLSAIKDGQAQSLDSHFHLRDDVIGKAL